jgi:hypothetical protein
MVGVIMILKRFWHMAYEVDRRRESFLAMVLVNFVIRTERTRIVNTVS